MTVIGCNKLTLTYGVQTILDSVSFSLNEGDKLGIVGVNGAGKSTLLKMITGEIEPTDGSVFVAKDKKLAYLAQICESDSRQTVLKEMLDAFPHLQKMENDLAVLQNAAEAGDNDAAMRFASLHEKFIAQGGLEYVGRCKGILTSLGFDSRFWDEEIVKLSGGQKTRVMLARILLSEPDIILLDEPTNHLDIDSIRWLENYLEGSRKTLVVVSHDRYFLCKTTNLTLEIEGCKAKLYQGNYDYYSTEKKREREIQAHQYKEQQKEIARIEAYIEQQRRWNRERNIIAAESRQKQLDKLERIEAPSKLPDSIRMSFSKGEESGYDVLNVHRLSKAFPGRQLFDNLSFEVKKKDRLFIIGPNGCGKSTLLKILTGKLSPDRGSFNYGVHVTQGYYDQENQNLNEANTVLDELWDQYGHLPYTEVRSALALFLFKGEDVFKEISVLSGGEKARITFAKLMLSKFNLLYLDEPTNHLDILSREVLEEALMSYDGTIIAVSHDRYFIKKLATRILAFDNQGQILDYKDGYEEYIRYIEQYGMANDSASREERVTQAKQEYLQNKQQNAERRKAERKVKLAKEEMEQIEKRLSDLPSEIDGASTDHQKLSALYEEQETLENRLMEIMELLDEAGEI